MTMFEKRPDGTTYDDRDSHHGWDSHQQHGGLVTAENPMSTWTVAVYDYAEQVLKAQRQFVQSMLISGAPMLDVVRGITSPDTKEDSSANNQLDARSDQHHDGSHGSNERYNDDDTAEYDRRSVDDNRSDDNTSDTDMTERAKIQAEQSAKIRTPVTASANERKLL